MSIRRVLIIDDQPDMLDMFKDFFQQEGWEADTAEDGQLGFRKATTDVFDLIICDLYMPNWDGVEAIRSIETVKPDSKVLVVTGFEESEKAQALSGQSNVIGILPKPADFEEIKRILDTYNE